MANPVELSKDYLIDDNGKIYTNSTGTIGATGPQGPPGAIGPQGPPGSGGGGGGAMVLIASDILAAAAPSKVFNSIVDTYNHLVLMVAARSNNPTNTDGLRVRFNSDNGNNYDWSFIESNGTYGITNQNYGDVSNVAANTATAGLASYFDIRIPNYSKTIFYKGYILNGYEGHFNRALTEAGTWKNTAAITSISFYLASGSNFVIGSAFYLYGIT
jgi:hypothetical protein